MVLRYCSAVPLRRYVSLRVAMRRCTSLRRCVVSASLRRCVVASLAFPLSQELELRVGTIVYILRNLSIADGLVNGAKAMVRQLNNYSVEVELLKDGKVHVIPRINFSFTISGLTVARKQLPLRVAYAGTLHKAQGKTLDKVLLVLTHDCFAHGQLYVGCTRVAGAKHIAVLLPAPAADTGDDTRNTDKSKRTSPVPPPTVINVVSRALVADADASCGGAHALSASVLPRVRGQRFPADPDAHAEADAWDAPVPLNLPDGDSDTDDDVGSDLSSDADHCWATETFV
eukprot:gene57074-biopygen57656